MKIEMGYYEVIEAVEAFLEKKHNVKVALEETELYIEYQKVIYKPLRYKNGKLKIQPEIPILLILKMDGDIKRNILKIQNNQL